MDFSMKQVLKVVVVLACAVAVVGTSIVLTNKNNSNAQNKNDSLWNLVGNTNGGNNDTLDGPLVSKTESQVGKYADIDGDGTVDGIIFADLMIGGSGIWNDWNTKDDWTNSKGTYLIPTISSAKDYYVSQESYTNKLGGTAEVLTPIGTGENRFYIMSLSNLSGTSDWYNAARGNMNDYATATNQEFGKGKDNTATMISKWEAKAYGEQDYKDVWGRIKTQANNGWFVPSSGEWAAFAGQLGITKKNFKSKDLSGYYWSSSQCSAINAYFIHLTTGDVSSDYVSNLNYVRLATTF